MNAIKHISQYATAKIERDELIIWALGFTQTDFIKVKIHNLDIEGEKEELFCFDAETLYGYLRKYPPQEKVSVEITKNTIKIFGDKIEFTTPIIKIDPAADAEEQIKLPWKLKFSVNMEDWKKFLKASKIYKVDIISRPEEDKISVVSYFNPLDDTDYLELAVPSKEYLDKKEFIKISFAPELLRKTTRAPVKALNFHIYKEDNPIKITAGSEDEQEIIYFIAPWVE